MVFDIRQPMVTQYGEIDEQKAERYQEELVALFEESPECKRLKEAAQYEAYTGIMIEYGLKYFGITPPQMNDAILRQILFKMLPEKVVMLPESAPNVIEEIRAFWEFAQREFGLQNARKCLRVLEDNATRKLSRELSTPENFGIAKAMFMMGAARGYELDSEESIQEWMNLYNTELAQGIGQPVPLPGDRSIQAREFYDTIRRYLQDSARQSKDKPG